MICVSLNDINDRWEAWLRRVCFTMSCVPAPLVAAFATDWPDKHVDGGKWFTPVLREFGSGSTLQGRRCVSKLTRCWRRARHFDSFVRVPFFATNSTTCLMACSFWRIHPLNRSTSVSLASPPPPACWVAPPFAYTKLSYIPRR